MLTTAIRIARHFHEGQTDKNGEPYIDHCMRVASYLKTVDLKTIALLHDVLEDTTCTVDYLKDFFPKRIIEVVEILTHHPDEPRIEYYARIRNHPLAIQVKVCDILDNLMPYRVATLDDSTRLRLKSKYVHALEQLL
jgi:(p)ppGpp synthase/HD superfamily hydrolase